ncbi:MAG TPA: cytochrome b/b6 domain-containing protein [Gammaproteobacteria bacterium]
MPIKDTAAGYGWLSIALHWFTAIVVIVLLFIGDTISTLQGQERADTLLLHTSIAITSYVFLWARIILRFGYGHPGPLPKQRGVFFLIGKYVHYTLLAALAAMLISGPLMVWFGGDGIGVWHWFVIPSPFEQNFAVRDALHRVHAGAAVTVLILTLLHLVGVYKHSAFNQDGTFGKMLVPGKAHEQAEPARPPG